MILHGNFGLSDVNDAILSFPTQGTWYNYFTGEEISITGNSRTFRLNANQFLLFTNQKLSMPEGDILEDLITSIGPDDVDLSGFKLYPVPANDRINVSAPAVVNQFMYRIIYVKGSVLKEGSHTVSDNILQVDIKDFNAGLYIFEVSDNRQVLRKRFIKQ